MSTQTTERRVGSLKAGTASLPLTKMEIAGAITGLLHRTKVCQTFVNDHDVPLEAVYVHPLPPRASVHGFRLVIGKRVVEGLVQERGQARQAYQQAVAQGHRAALMEEERSDIFTTTVGNIAPGEQVSISFEVSGPLEFLESTASLKFPLVVPEVYIPGDALGGGDVGDGTAADTTSVPDASRITPPRLADGAANPVNLRLSFTVDPAGLELEGVDSLCHFAKTRQRDDGVYEISLLPGVERLDHDFVIRLKLKEGSLQTTMVHDPETGCFALTVVPPVGSGHTLAPRDLVIVLDRSGSMQGWSMTAARRSAARMVESLTPVDRFAIIAFDDRRELFEPQMVKAEARHKERAQEWLAQIEARGGTEARPAIEEALSLLRNESSSDRTVLFVTDGDVGNDSELVARSSGGVRISTVGIGNNSRAGVLEAMAKASGGLCTLLPEEKTLEEGLRNLHQRLGRPHWMGLSVQGLTVNDTEAVTQCFQAPRFWDVWEGVPTTFFGRAPNMGETVTVDGWLASSGKFSQQVAVRRRDDLVIHRAWARTRLLDLDDLWTIGKAEPSELVALSVEAQVLCRFTAFAAIDKAETVANTEQIRTVVQPVEKTLKNQAPLAKPSLGGKADMARGAMKRSMAPRPSAARGGASGILQPAPAAQAPMPCSPPPMSAPPSLRCQDAQDVLGGGGDLFSEAGPAAKSEAPPPLESKERKRGVVERLKDVFLSQEPARDIGEGGARQETAKRRQAQTIWEALLTRLEGFEGLTAEQKTALLEELVDSLGAYCRTAPAGSEQADAARELISLLVDLQTNVETGQDDIASVAALRKQLESARALG